MVKSTYFQNLIKKVIDKSESNTWEDAVEEWQISDMWEDANCSTSCVCGHENIKYCFVIKNENNSEILKPIGSSCIKKFERKELNEEIAIYEQLFKLAAELEKNNYDIKIFSRKLIKFLYMQDCIDDNDFWFLTDMFNRRVYTPTFAQDRKIYAITKAKIIPYLEKRLNRKIEYKGEKEALISEYKMVEELATCYHYLFSRRSLPNLNVLSFQTLEFIKDFIFANQWNDYNPENDYDFLVKIKKYGMTEKQKKKAMAILSEVLDRPDVYEYMQTVKKKKNGWV